MPENRVLTAIEFNSSTIRVCSSEIQKKNRVITNCFSFQSNATECNDAIRIKEAFKKSGFVRRSLVMVMLPRYIAMSRVVRLPSADSKELSAMMNLYVSKELCGIKLEDIIYDWRVVGIDKDGYSIVSVFLVLKDKVYSYLNILERTGILPDFVTINTAGLSNWLDPTDDIASGEKPRCAYLLNIDSDIFDFNMLSGRYSIFSRTFKLYHKDNSDYSNHLLKELKVSFELSRRFSVELFEPVQKFYVTGMVDRLEGLGLERHFNLPVEILRPCRGIPSEAEVSYAAVAGLALNGKIGAIDLTPVELKDKLKDRKRVIFLRRMSYLSLFLFFLSSVLLVFFMNAKIKNIDKLRLALAQDVLLENEARDFRIMQEAEKKFVKESLFAEMYAKLYQAVPEGMYLNVFDYVQGKGSYWSGSSPDAKSVFEFLSVLRKISPFEKTRLVFIEDRVKNDSRVNFKMWCPDV